MPNRTLQRQARALVAAEGISYQAALRRLKAPAQPTVTAIRLLGHDRSPQSLEVLDQLAGEGLTELTLRAFEVGWRDLPEGRVLTYTVGDDLAPAMTALDADRNWHRLPAGAGLGLYNETAAALSLRTFIDEPVVVCEGARDAWALHACGFRAVVAALGARFCAAQVQKLAVLGAGRPVVLAADADNPGFGYGAARLALAGVDVRVVSYAPGDKDPAGVLAARGARALGDLIDSATS